MILNESHSCRKLPGQVLEDGDDVHNVSSLVLLREAFDDFEERDITVFIIFNCFNFSLRTLQFMRYNSNTVGKNKLPM